jgi:hypothetical protein
MKHSLISVSHMRIVVLAFLLPLLASCSESPVATPAEPQPLRVKFERDAVFLEVGASTSIPVSVMGGPPEVDRRVILQSSDTSIVTVNPSTGDEAIIHALAPGTARIAAIAIADPAVRDTLQVVAVATTSPTPTIVITAIHRGGLAVPVDSTNVAGAIDVHFAAEAAQTGWTTRLILASGPAVSCLDVVQSRFAGTCTVDTAATDSSGTRIYSNGAHHVSVQLVRSDGVIMASNRRTLVINNPG